MTHESCNTPDADETPHAPKVSLVTKLRQLTCRLFVAGAVTFFTIFLLLGYTPVGKYIEVTLSKTPTQDQLTPADAIVVLGGDPYRAVTGAELYKKGLAPRLILSGDAKRFCDTLAVCDIPPAVIEIDPDPVVTGDHPFTIQSLPGITPETRLIVVTSKPHPARVRMIFARAGFRNVQVYAMDAEWEELFQDRGYVGPVDAMRILYELIAYGKDVVRPLR